MSKRVVSKLVEQEVAKREKERVSKMRTQGLAELFTPAEQARINQLAEENPQSAIDFAAQETLVKKTRNGRHDLQAVLREQMLLTEHQAQFRLTCSPASYMKSRFNESIASEQWMVLEAWLWTLEESELPPPGAQREWRIGAMPDGAFVIAHESDEEGAAWRAIATGKARELAREKVFDELAGGQVSRFLPLSARTPQALDALADRITAVSFDDAPAVAFSCVSQETLDAGINGADQIEWQNANGEWEAVTAQKAREIAAELSQRAQGINSSSLDWLFEALSPERRLADGLARWGL